MQSLRPGITHSIKGALVVLALLIPVVIAVRIHRRCSSAAFTRSAAPMQTEAWSLRASREGFVSLADVPLIRELRGEDDARAAPAPPVAFVVGRADSADAPDLSTPAQAVHSVLSLLDRAETDQLSRCFAGEGTPDVNESLYPRYLGPPVELVDVIEEGDAAKVVWTAAVHTEFSLDGVRRSPGETVTLRTRLVQRDGFWRLLGLHEGVVRGQR